MIMKEVTLKGPLPLPTARARELINTASSFSCRILLRFGPNTINGKSMLGLLSLGKLGGRNLCVFMEGEDEVEAMAAYVPLLEQDHKDS